MAVEDNGNPFADESLTKHPSVEAQPADGNPFADPALTSPEYAQQNTGQVTTFVPNARIRNLPNPAEGLTPGQALINGVQTGAEVAAVPATAIGLGEVVPV